METQETKRCPYCGEEILAVAKKCKHCGSWLIEESNVSTKTITCPACGENVKEGTQCCPHCGETIEQNNSTTSIVREETERRTSKKSNSNNAIILGIIGFIIVICLFVFFIQKNSKSVNNESISANVDSVGVQNTNKVVNKTPMKNWEITYGQNENGEEDKSDAVISQTFYGKNNGKDCELQMHFSTTEGLIFVVKDQQVNFTNCIVKAKVGNHEYNLSPSYTEECVIYFMGESSIQTIINLLECGEMFEISITDGDNSNSQFIYEIYGDTDVTKALAKIGINVKAEKL